MTGKIRNLRLINKGTWEVAVWVNGKREYRYCKTRKLALEVRDELEALNPTPALLADEPGNQKYLRMSWR